MERACKWGQPCGGEQAAGCEDYTERLYNVFAKCLTTVYPVKDEEKLGGDVMNFQDSNILEVKAIYSYGLYYLRY